MIKSIADHVTKINDVLFQKKAIYVTQDFHNDCSIIYISYVNKNKNTM